MKHFLHFFNIIYNIIFRIVTFMASFYIFSSLLFYFIPYHTICTSVYTLFIFFAILCLLSYFFMNMVIAIILRLTR